MKKILHYIGIIIFILGVCSADSECLLIPMSLTFGGFALAYLMRGDYYDNY